MPTLFARRSVSTGVAALAGVMSVCLNPAAYGQCETATLNGSYPKGVILLGTAVAIHDDLAVFAYGADDAVEAPRVRVFRFAHGSWEHEATLTHPTLDPFNEFGKAVATNGKVIIIGTPADDSPEFHSGSALVFRYDGSNWNLETILTASDGDFNDIFGFSVSMDGDVAVIGARDDDNDGVPQSGSAYVFRYNRATATWVEEQKLTASTPTQSQGFGNSVSISGDVVVVGAPGSAVDPRPAFVFRYDGVRWSQEAELTAFDPGIDDRFGFAVSTNGEVAVIGSPQAAQELGPHLGAGYVFRYRGARWTFETKLTASEPGGPSPYFGARLSLRLDASAVLIGAPFDHAIGFESGAAHLFRYDGTVWKEVNKLTPSDAQPNAQFGTSTSLSGDLAVIATTGSAAAAGAGYVFAGLSGIDCNANGEPDACDLFGGTSEDGNANGIPDECDADLNGDGTVGIIDLLILLTSWGLCPDPPDPCPADLNGDGTVGVRDLLILLANWG